MRANLPSSSLDMNTYSVSNYGDRDVRAGAKARKGDRHDRPNLSSFFGCDAAELVGGSQEPAVAHAAPLTRIFPTILWDASPDYWRAVERLKTAWDPARILSPNHYIRTTP